MFWHGAPLSRLERVSIASFVQNGHPVDVYAYDELKDLPAGAVLKDAAQILPRSALFLHERTRSLAAFSDWFRYRILYECGGIWADTDVICLRPLDYDQPEIYAWQDERYINGAVLGLPPRHKLAEWLANCCEHPNAVRPYDDVATRFRKFGRWLWGNRRGNIRWGEHGPKGLTKAAHFFGHAGRALPHWHFYPVAPDDFRCLFDPAGSAKMPDLGRSRTVHLWNELLRQNGLDPRHAFPAAAPFERFCARYLGATT
jgi:hypothetical protein